MNKQRFINAYIWLFGTTKKEASKAYKTASTEYIHQIIETFENNAKRAFITD